MEKEHGTSNGEQTSFGKGSGEQLCYAGLMGKHCATGRTTMKMLCFVSLADNALAGSRAKA
jgi:hypothetical protein